MIMKISQLQEPYKTLAKFFMKQVSKKTDMLNDAFHWGSCTGRNYVSHNTFWNKVNKGQKPQVPESIASYYQKKSGKKLPVVMGMPKKLTEKQKAEVKENVRKAVLKKAAAKVSAEAVGPTPEQLEAFKLIGRVMRPFKFKSGTNGLTYHESMDNLLGHEGTIVEANSEAVLLSFRRVNYDIQFWYPFGKDVKCTLLGETAEEHLIPVEEVEEAMAIMPEKPFIVGQTVYFKSNGEQFKCKVTHANISGRVPISVYPGKRFGCFCTTLDGRCFSDKYPSLSHTPWYDKNGVMLNICNLEPEEPIRTKDQIIAALEKDLDDAYKNEEAMLKELNTNLDRILFHCHSVQENTGNVTIDDITYCTILVRRVMENKFGYKPKQEEV